MKHVGQKVRALYPRQEIVSSLMPGLGIILGRMEQSVTLNPDWLHCCYSCTWHSPHLLILTEDLGWGPNYPVCSLKLEIYHFLASRQVQERGPEESVQSLSCHFEL